MHEEQDVDADAVRLEVVGGLQAMHAQAPDDGMGVLVELLEHLTLRFALPKILELLLLQLLAALHQRAQLPLEIQQLGGKPRAFLLGGFPGLLACHDRRLRPSNRVLQQLDLFLQLGMLALEALLLRLELAVVLVGDGLPLLRESFLERLLVRGRYLLLSLLQLGVGAVDALFFIIFQSA